MAPPWYPVPPNGYGGIELVVGLLAGALRATGHRVTVLGAAGSEPGTQILAPRSWGADLGGGAERLRELTYAARVLGALTELGHVDVVHDHTGFATLFGLTHCAPAPVVHTVHGSIREVDRCWYAELDQWTALVAISDAQRASSPDLGWVRTVHNAINLDELEVGPAGGKEPYLLCLARICPDKGQHIAIEVARRTGHRLVLAGKIEPTDQGVDYYERHVAPAIDNDRVIHVLNVAGAEKAQLLTRATALLAPIQWEEPFGLAVVEAMASGTPAVAMRRGAVPELIVDGVTGFCVDGVDGMVDAVLETRHIDSQHCAAVTRDRFSPAAMAAGYLRAYDEVVTGTTAPLAGWQVVAHAQEVLSDPLAAVE